MCVFTPNQPIMFGQPNLNEYPLCGCIAGRGYYQPISQNDITRFQLPNLCHKSLGTNLTPNGEFSVEGQFNAWSQGTGNGNSVVWTYDTGKARTLGDSKILNITLASFTTPYKKYKISISSDLCTDAIIHVVGYKSYSGDSSTDYTEITTFSTGADTYEFIAEETYLRIGFWVEGGCVEDFSDVDYFRIYEYVSDECLTLCLKDLDDNIVDSDIGTLEYFHDFVTAELDWSTLGIDDGCYKLCLCNDDIIYAENLFTDASNGTFDDVEGITGTGTQSTEQAYLGDYSYKIVIDGTASQNIITLTSSYKLKRNTTYEISAWVYIDAAFSPVADAYLSIAPDFTGDTIVTNGNIEPTADNQTWVRAYTRFTTGDNPTGTFDVFLSGTDWSLYNGDPLYIDNILLYEVGAYVPCSQPFKLQDNFDCTLLFTYSNPQPAFGFYFPAGFEFTLRIDGNINAAYRYPEQAEQFQTGEGLDYLSYASSKKIRTLKTGYLPEWVHDALRLAIVHKSLNINGTDYIKEPGDYSPGAFNKSCESSVEFEIREPQQNIKNTSC